MHSSAFQGPTEEFLRAHEHYRKGRYKEAIADALKAFESTMKAICDEQQWTYDPHRDTAAALLKVLFTKNLLPSYLDQQLTQLRMLLESGVPTVRNRTSGHGQGRTPVDLPDYVAAYALHLAATNIVFLVEAHKAKVNNDTA